MGEYFRFSGRLNRKPYWLRTLALYAILIGTIIVVSFVGGGLGSLVGGSEAVETGLGIVGIIAAIVMFVVFVGVMIASLALQVRRLHDRNKSGWWLLFFMFVPGIVQVGLAATGVDVLALVGVVVSLGISLWFLVEVGFLRGTDGPNHFGEDPLGAHGDAAAVFA